VEHDRASVGGKDRLLVAKVRLHEPNTGDVRVLQLL
jgi:hypothetical protein